MRADTSPLRRPPPPGVSAAGLYLFVVLFWLWPLPLSIGSGLTPDLGDPLLNTWILAWNFHQFEGGAGSYWDAGIFWPAPDALTFSESLLPVALLVYPVWAVSRNPVLAYNVGLMLGFVLTGWATFLLSHWYLSGNAVGAEPAAAAERHGRPRTGRADAGEDLPAAGGEEETLAAGEGPAPPSGQNQPAARDKGLPVVAAALLAGLAAAFSTYRVDQLTHIQVMWIGWLPLTVYCAERYLARPHAGWLWAAAAAGLALALTNTYFAVFGGITLVVFVVLRGLPALVRRTPRPPTRHAAHVVAAALLAGAALLMVGARYREAQQRYEIERPPWVVEEFSARPGDVLRSSTQLVMWGERLGDLHEYAERHLFPGITLALLALVGFLAPTRSRDAARAADTAAGPRGARGADTTTRDQGAATATASPGRRRWPGRVFATIALLGSTGVALLMAGIEIRWEVGDLTVRMTHVDRPLALAAIGLAGWLATVPAARSRLQRRLGLHSPHGWIRFGLLAAAFMALGNIDADSEWWLAELLPLAAGLRVPTRSWAIVMLCAALLAGRGVHRLLGGMRRPFAVSLAIAAGVLILAESFAAPVDINRPIWIYPRLDLDRLLEDPDTELARRLARLPQGTPILELPVGESQLALAYMYRSTRHWQPLVNGFSGFLPPAYGKLRARLEGFPDDESRATLEELGVEWLVVHPELWRGARRQEIGRSMLETEWLEIAGYWPDGVLVRFLAAPSSRPTQNAAGTAGQE